MCIRESISPLNSKKGKGLKPITPGISKSPYCENLEKYLSILRENTKKYGINIQASYSTQTWDKIFTYMVLLHTMMHNFAWEDIFFSCKYDTTLSLTNLN